MNRIDITPTSHFIDVDNLRLHYLECGAGEPVLLLHGWPTSSFLWRNVMVHIAQHNRVIALDLPGFGHSDKPLDASYSFRFYSRVLDGFLQALDIQNLGLVVHDLGGPIGLYWSCHHKDRVTKLALLNTVVYPQFSWAVVAFLVACRLPLLRSWLTSPWGLKKAMQIGIYHADRVTSEVVEGVQAPFPTVPARRALLKAAIGLHPKGLQEIQQILPTFQIPVRVIYGTHDRILPDVAKTMRRVQRDLPHAQVTALEHCGHFLQEDNPDHVGQLLANFFAMPHA